MATIMGFNKTALIDKKNKFDKMAIRYILADMCQSMQSMLLLRVTQLQVEIDKRDKEQKKRDKEINISYS